MQRTFFFEHEISFSREGQTQTLSVFKSSMKLNLKFEKAVSFL